MPEARSGKRFPLQLPINVLGKPGVTRNVSGAGVYVEAEQTLTLGSAIELDITLPAEEIGGVTDVHVHCIGHVVRVDPPGKREGELGGVACVIDHYKMVRKQPC